MSRPVAHASAVKHSCSHQPLQPQCCCMCCTVLAQQSRWLYLIIAEGAAHLLATCILVQCNLLEGIIALNDLGSTLCNLLRVWRPG